MRPERTGHIPSTPSRIRSDKELSQLASKVGAKGSFLEKNIEYFHQFLTKAMQSKNMASFSLAMTLVSTGDFSVMKGYLEKYPEMKDKILNFLRENHQKISRQDLRVIFKNLTGSDKVVDIGNLGANNKSKAIEGFIVAPPPVVHPIPAKCLPMLEAGNLLHDQKGNKFPELNQDEFEKLYRAVGHEKMLALLAGSPMTMPLIPYIDKNGVIDNQQSYALYLLAHRATVIEKTENPETKQSEMNVKLDSKKLDDLFKIIVEKNQLPGAKNEKLSEEDLKKLTPLIDKFIKDADLSKVKKLKID